MLESRQNGCKTEAVAAAEGLKRLILQQLLFPCEKTEAVSKLTSVSVSGDSLTLARKSPCDFYQRNASYGKTLPWDSLTPCKHSGRKKITKKMFTCYDFRYSSLLACFPLRKIPPVFKCNFKLSRENTPLPVLSFSAVCHYNARVSQCHLLDRSI